MSLVELAHVPSSFCKNLCLLAGTHFMLLPKAYTSNVACLMLDPVLSLPSINPFTFPAQKEVIIASSLL